MRDDEKLVDQIDTLKSAFSEAAEGKFTLAETQNLLVKPTSEIPVDMRLASFQIALLNSLQTAIRGCHAQISDIFLFLRVVTFFARRVCPDVSFWTTEINDDLEQTKFLFCRA
ncbi:MAG TPA: hypothetical protein PKX87_04335, partial [Alphaproteobacteria bacterium]|nr:hypothetical protein [Alphaproteobacteria bacterium]